MTRTPLVLGAALLLSACCGARNDLIVVLPGADGHVGGVTVEAAGATMVLDKAYAGAKPGGQGAMAPVEMSKTEVEEIFANALAARPIPPKSYVLYFVTGGTTLAPDSQATMDAMLKEVGERKAVEIVITGHTDTVGGAADNDRLSLERAQAVEAALRETFAARGVMSDAVTAVGRGERELLSKTADQVSEPKNRRVEITVR